MNDEFMALVRGLEAAERALRPGGKLAVVSFHSIEDRVVKRFLAERASRGGGGSRHAPAEAARDPGFDLTPRKAIPPDPEEIAANPRARSAKLRVATRTQAPAQPVQAADLGVPQVQGGW